MNRFKFLFGTFFILSVLIFSPVWKTTEGAVPKLINFQGILKDGSGNPVADGSYFVTFRIYDAATGGSTLWADTQTVATSSGLFNATLGTGTPVPDSIFNDTSRYLGIIVFPDPEMTPRQRLLSVTYAYRLSTVDGASGGTITSKVSIGTGHTNTGADAFVAGKNNVATGDNGTVGGGVNNTVNATGATVGGGRVNTASGTDATVGGGIGNTASAQVATVSGGNANMANAAYATISGGTGNTSGFLGTVGGGSNNTATGTEATISGGGNNTASGVEATVSGGRYNKAQGWFSVVAGGGGGVPADSNLALGNQSAVGGGRANLASGIGAVVSGGSFNKARGNYSVVGGGGGAGDFDSNSAIGDWSTISGGESNAASFAGATVGGGSINTASGYLSTVGGGQLNTASGTVATVGGGYSDTASGNSATVPGGTGNKASGSFSFAAGRRAKALHAGAFVWADTGTTGGDDFASTANNQFLIRAAGGVGIGIDAPTARLQVGLAGVEGTPLFIAGTQIVAQATNGGNWAHMAIISSSSGQSRLNFGDAVNDDQGSVGYNNSNDAMFFITAAAEQMRITSTGNVGIGTNSPQGALDVSSTTGAFIVPRMTTVQRNALTAVNGMVIYNTDAVAGGRFEFRENGAWVTK